MILEIKESVQIEVERSNNMIGIGIDDDLNQCMSNDYNGDHAYVMITLEQANKLILMLQKAINEEN